MTKAMTITLLVMFAIFIVATLLMMLGVIPPLFFYPVGLATVGYGFYCYLRLNK